MRRPAFAFRDEAGRRSQGVVPGPFVDFPTDELSGNESGVIARTEPSRQPLALQEKLLAPRVLTLVASNRGEVVIGALGDRESVVSKSDPEAFFNFGVAVHVALAPTCCAKGDERVGTEFLEA